MKTHRDVRIPSTADDWQLYDMTGSARAARSLTNSLVKAMDMFCDLLGQHDVPSAASKALETHMRPAMSKCSKFGATDTEPRGQASAAMECLVSRIVGENVYLDLWF